MKIVWLRIALLNFVIAAALGAILRLAYLTEIPTVDFRNVLHAHSHVAMLGWIYLALFALLVGSFLDDKVNTKKYGILFWLTQVAVVGMLISFYMQGYAAASITFSTLHILFSFIFCFWFFRDLKPNPDQAVSQLFVKSALLFMVLSTLGVWMLAYTMASGLRGSMIYYTSVQFFLHFQFNGWFLFAVLGLFFRYLEKNRFGITPNSIRLFYILLLISTFATFALAVAWMNPLKAVFWVNSIGVAIQLAALGAFILILTKVFALRSLTRNLWTTDLFKLAFVSVVLKILIQSSVAIPYIATIAYTVRNYVIGFIHLVLLAVISLFIIGYAIENKWLKIDRKLAKAGVVIFILGIFLSEFILFAQGTMLWAEWGFMPVYHELIFGASVLMPVGLGMLLVGCLNGEIV